MNAKVRKALESSIRHWERNVTGRTHTIGPEHCALCRLFYYKKACVGCPVRARTGKSHCSDSPYAAAGKAHAKFGGDSIQFRGKALEELRFLESLRP